MSNICVAPICEYSKKKQKCIKPNPYIEYISNCKKYNKINEDCNLSYKLHKDIAIKNVCKYHLNRVGIVQNQISNPKEKLKNMKLKEIDLLNELKKIEKERKYKLKELEKNISISSIIIKTSSPKKQNNLSTIRSNKRHISPIMKDKSLFFVDNRISNYNIVSKYINSRKKYSNNCVKVYEINNSIPILRIGNRIILTKRIGADSAYGTVYYSYYHKNKNDSYNENIIFATKIIERLPNNIIEYNILETLTKSVANNEFIHFPMSYGLLECYDNNINSEYSSYKINNNKLLDKYIPSKIAKYNSLYIILTELANGDLESFLNSYYNNDEIILNTLIQIFLSLMFFYKKINAFHADAHNGNFLYHKIKPGGYFHYNIYGVDYYLKNIGFLWVIWDFGLIRPFSNSAFINNNKYGVFSSYEKITYDYEYLLNSFKNINNNGWVSNKYLLSENIKTIIKDLTYLFNSNYNYDVTKIPELNILLLSYVVSNISSFTLNKPDNIINKEPYILI